MIDGFEKSLSTLKLFKDIKIFSNVYYRIRKNEQPREYPNTPETYKLSEQTKIEQKVLP
jgi:hypothetical protein